MTTEQPPERDVEAELMALERNYSDALSDMGVLRLQVDALNDQCEWLRSVIDGLIAAHAGPAAWDWLASDEDDAEVIPALREAAIRRKGIVQTEIRPNGGPSFRDEVNRLNTSVPTDAQEAE